MRIDQLIVQNFKGFDTREFSFHPQFNLIVGVNGTGKTSTLDALAVAIGSWFLGVKGADSRHIRPNEVLLGDFEHEDIDDEGKRHFSVHWENVYPCRVQARGEVLGERIEWVRALNGPGGRTTYSEATQIKKLATQADAAVRKGEDVTLPLISYYGTGRLWLEPRDSYQVSDPMRVADKEELSRFAGYWNSVDPRLSVGQLTRWIARQSWISYQQGNRTPPVFAAVKNAIVSCVEGATNIYFDAVLGEVVVEMQGGTQPFSNLSDGQRSMLALVGDIAHKAAKLNPHLGAKVLDETTGVVLIDELDLHLHPRWQRRIIEDLRRTFPKVQFICTTHSPQLIGQAKADEILLLGQSEGHPGQSYGMDSNWILRHVMGSDDRDPVIAGKLDAIFEDIENAQFDFAQEKLNALRVEIGDHPDLVEAEALISRYTRFDRPTTE